MSTCFVLGESSHVSSTARTLTSAGLSAKPFVMPHRMPGFYEMCKKEAGLALIAVFCRDLPDDGLEVIKALRGIFKEKVRIHALFDARQPQKSEVERHVDKVSWAFPLRPVDAASFLMRDWAAYDRARVRAEEALEDAEENRERKSVAVAANVSPLPTQKKHASAPKPPPPKQREEKSDCEKIGAVLTSITKNTLLPEEQVVVDIHGLPAGMSVELDPRRVKPLPDNPRWATNPGFSPESIRGLAENIKAVGQAENVLVCPIVGDPDFDAQLLDGERRLRAAKAGGFMIRADIRPEITPAMKREMWLLSVIRNMEKAPHTTLEIVEMVKRLRSEEFGFTALEVAGFFGKKSPTWTMQQEMLGSLHPEVQLMLDETQETPESGGRRLTSQIGLLLYDVEKARQLTTAREILERKMTYNQARRHVLQVRRDLGLKENSAGRNRPKQHFQALATLTRQNIDAFGVFLDLPTAEMMGILAMRTSGERNGLAQDLRALVKDLNILAGKIEVQE